MFRAASTKKISVVIPVFSEQESLPELIGHTSTTYKRLGKDYEILLVSDSSSDRSTRLMIGASRTPNSRIVSILLNRNHGQYSAIMVDFSHVTEDLIITLDANLQDPPEEISRLVATTNEGSDMVGTVRRNHRDSVFRRTASRMISHLIQRTTGKAMDDHSYVLHAYRCHIVDTVLHCQERSTFIPILANIFIRCATKILVYHAERKFGDSKYSFTRLINLMYDLVTCLTAIPLRMLSLLGSAIVVAGFTLSVLFVVLRLTFGPQWATEGVFMLFAVLFTSIDAQFTSTGLLGEYISRIYNDVHVRLHYSVQHATHP